MYQDITLPDDLNTVLASESKDFVVNGRFVEAPWKPISNIVLGALWIIAVLYMGSGFDFSGFSAEGIKEIAAGLKESAANKDYPQLIFPIVFFGVFLSIGIYYMIFKGVGRLFKRGGIFVGTPTKLYNYKNGQTTYNDWVEFTGNIKVKGNDKRGTVIIERTTGYKLKRAHTSSVYVPYTAYINGIAYANDIAKICKKRIAECNAGKYSD
jgi:hypothetical protein